MMTPPTRRILMTTDAVGGVWTYATGLVRGLCGRSDEVTLVVMGPAPRADQLAPFHDIRGLCIELTDLVLEWMDPDGSDIAKARERLLRIARQVRPDIIHLNSYREAVFDWPAPVLVVAHSCVWSWWQACRGGEPDDLRWHRYREAAAAGLAAADMWCAPSEAFHHTIEALYPVRSSGRVIHNGARLQAACHEKKPFILAAGRLWDEAKNLSTLAAIASDLDWSVQVAGPLAAPDSDENCSDEVNLTCLGNLSRPELTAQMQRASIFAAPALYEPFGLSVLEAAACGCALALSDIPSLRELWQGAALFVAASDRGAWRNALQRLTRDHGLRTQLQRAALLRARRYSLDAMVDAYREVHRTMANRAFAHAAPARTPMSEGVPA
jgi:glycosyltransferase involved in cell wall biosynthesis